MIGLGELVQEALVAQYEAWLALFEYVDALWDKTKDDGLDPANDPRFSAVAGFDQLAQPMRLCKESVLQFTLDSGWQVRFTERDSTEPYTLTMIGWAVTVRWTSYNDPDIVTNEYGSSAEMCIEPVVNGMDGMDGMDGR